MSNWLIGICNAAIKGIGVVLNALLALLPNSPFHVSNSWFSGIDAVWFQYLCWLVPVDAFVTLIVDLLSAMAIYYIYMVVFRWFKLIG